MGAEMSLWNLKSTLPYTPQRYTVKTSGSAWPGLGSIGAKLHYGGQRWPGISQLDAGIGVNLTPLFVKIFRKLAKYWVTFDKERTMTQMDPFPGHADPGVFRV